MRAALISSKQLSLGSNGALCNKSGSVSTSAAIDRMASMKASRFSLGSVSVGSIIMAPLTTWGEIIGRPIERVIHQAFGNVQG